MHCICMWCTRKSRKINHQRDNSTHIRMGIVFKLVLHRVWSHKSNSNVDVSVSILLWNWQLIWCWSIKWLIFRYENCLSHKNSRWIWFQLTVSKIRSYIIVRWIIRLTRIINRNCFTSEPSKLHRSQSWAYCCFAELRLFNWIYYCLEVKCTNQNEILLLNAFDVNLHAAEKKCHIINRIDLRMQQDDAQLPQSSEFYAIRAWILI